MAPRSHPVYLAGHTKVRFNILLLYPHDEFSVFSTIQAPDILRLGRVLLIRVNFVSRAYISIDTKSI